MAEGTRGERILVVDDDVHVRELCARVLSNEGYTVFSAANAAEARACLDREPLDLLVVDIHLPQESGLSLLKHAQDVHPGVPAVLITGQAETSTVIDAIRLNVREYLCKPFTLRQLREAVAQHVGRTGVP
jgi:DNA-binding NtrC family response regulator